MNACWFELLNHVPRLIMGSVVMSFIQNKESSPWKQGKKKRNLSIINNLKWSRQLNYCRKIEHLRCYDSGAFPEWESNDHVPEVKLQLGFKGGIFKC